MQTIPREFAHNDLHVVASMLRSIETTHPGLGDLALMSKLAEVANRTLVVIGISGIGKSCVSSWVEKNPAEHRILNEHGLTVNGLAPALRAKGLLFASEIDDKGKPLAEKLSAPITCLVEDLARGGGTDYI